MIHTHKGTLTIDTTDVLVDEVEAEYEVEARWSNRNMRGYRSVHVDAVTLKNWGETKRSRDLAVTLAGEAMIEEQERRAYDDWIATAEQDDAEEYADHQNRLREEG